MNREIFFDKLKPVIINESNWREYYYSDGHDIRGCDLSNVVIYIWDGNTFCR
jgi:hypothetical protein